uniref:Capsanthin/capsorubin synthase n=1 Tax=Lilium pumilum TaxID=82327 RepID=A0A1U9YG00_9LILI|nr:capsanthin/capsorubin synthase [Lilium pumilum]
MSTLQLPALLTAGELRHPSRRTKCSSIRSFLDLTPVYKPEPLTIDIPYHDPSSAHCYDAAIIGCGPAGLRLAECAAARGLRVCCIDPAPLSPWPNNYGAWLDELHPLGLASIFDHIWPTATVAIDGDNVKHLSRPYGRVNRTSLKTLLLENCTTTGVRFHPSKAWNIEHEELRSSVSCSDGSAVTASLVIDAGGFSTPFIEYDRPRNRRGYQIAHGILAEVNRHPFDLNQMLLMDWSDAHLDNEPHLRAHNAAIPTFLYAMPINENLVFLEETSIVSRPVLDYSEVKKRMVARLRHLGIKVERVLEEEKCLFPMGGPLPQMPQRVMGFGGAGGMVHPSSGYQMARALALAPELAEAMVECLGSTRMIRGESMNCKVWGSLWPAGRRWEREYYLFGMETLLSLDLKETRRFFDSFFNLEPRYWHGFMSSRLSIKELAGLSLSLFAHASWKSRVDIVTKCPLPLARTLGNLALQAI